MPQIDWHTGAVTAVGARQVVQHVTGDQGDVHRDGHIDVQPVGGPPWLVGRLRVNMLRILRPVCVADLRELVDVPGGVRQLQPPRGVKTKPADRHDGERSETKVIP